MPTMIEMVREFHEKFGQPVASKSARLDVRRANLRADLIIEESDETCCAINLGVGAEEIPQLVEIADGLADLIYVAIGTALEYGIDLDRIFSVVHAANMRKVGGPTRSDGKILKPPGWIGPEAEIEQIIKESMK